MARYDCFGKSWVSPELRPEWRCASCKFEEMCWEEYTDRMYDLLDDWEEDDDD